MPLPYSSPALLVFFLILLMEKSLSSYRKGKTLWDPGYAAAWNFSGSIARYCGIVACKGPRKEKAEGGKIFWPQQHRPQGIPNLHSTNLDVLCLTIKFCFSYSIFPSFHFSHFMFRTLFYVNTFLKKKYDEFI